eukprot:43787-Eustigmatos_ZCMA.PRE.1
MTIRSGIIVVVPVSNARSWRFSTWGIRRTQQISGFPQTSPQGCSPGPTPSVRERCSSYCALSRDRI